MSKNEDNINDTNEYFTVKIPSNFIVLEDEGSSLSVEILLRQINCKLDNLISNLPLENNPKLVMSIAEYVRYSGISDYTLRAFCAATAFNFPCFKINGKTLIHVKAADVFLLNAAIGKIKI